MADIQALLDIMARLRDPERGCPWDVKQDFASIAPYTVEEAYEVADAVLYLLSDQASYITGAILNVSGGR